MENKTIYQPEFIPYYIEDITKLKLSPLEGLAYGFIKFYGKSNPFYFNSEDFGRIIGTSKGTIDNIISKLVKKNVIKTETIRYNVDGKIRSSRKITFIYECSHYIMKTLSSSNNEDTTSSNDENNTSSNDEIKDNNKNNKKDNNKKIQKKDFFENKKINGIFLEFIENRKQMKKSMTELAIKKVINKINKWQEKYSEDQIYYFIEKSIESGWQSIFEVFPNGNNFSKQKEKLSYEKQRNPDQYFEF